MARSLPVTAPSTTWQPITAKDVDGGLLRTMTMLSGRYVIGYAGWYYLAAEAIARTVDSEVTNVEVIERGLADVKAGRLVPHEQRWSGWRPRSPPPSGQTWTQPVLWSEVTFKERTGLAGEHRLSPVSHGTYARGKRFLCRWLIFVHKVRYMHGQNSGSTPSDWPQGGPKTCKDLRLCAHR
jgi:hypothetical protein